MAIPTLLSALPEVGPTSGGDLVRLVGTGFGPRIAIRFGDAPAELVALRDEAGSSIADVRTPRAEAGVVDVTLVNLDASGGAIPGESVTRVGLYRFVRATIAREADLTRAIRQLLRELKRQVLVNVSATVSVDYDDTPADGLSVIAMAKVPSLVLSGPVLRPNRFYATNIAHEDVVAGSSGPELVRRKPPYTADLVFTLTAASKRTAELFNLLAAVTTFLNRNRWLVLLRDPSEPARGTARWEMDAEGDFRSQLGGKEEVQGFTCGFVVRGFDVDEGLPLDFGRRVSEPRLETEPLQGDAP